MIKFVPQLKEVRSILADKENWVDNHATNKMTEHMNKLESERSCPAHPDVESVILVHYQNEGPVMTVESFCCEDFKQKLNMIANNQRPPEA